jgi:hypothetical protein
MNYIPFAHLTLRTVDRKSARARTKVWNQERLSREVTKTSYVVYGKHMYMMLDTFGIQFRDLLKTAPDWYRVKMHYIRTLCILHAKNLSATSLIPKSEK